MAFDFPASPTDGTVFSPAGGPTYIYSGGVWKISGGGGAFVVVADAAPPSPYPGMLWFESDTGALFFWYVDADSSQWVQINFTPSGMLTAQTRNRIVNPCFQIQQDVTMAAAYVVDQWIASTTIATATYLRGGDQTPFGSKYNISLNHTTPKPSLATTDFHGFGQAIEGVRITDFKWGTAAARQVVLRFAVWSTVAGTFNVSLLNGPTVTRSYVDTFTISAGEINTYAYKTLVIPGDVTGAWNINNAVGLYLYVTLAAGSTYTTATRGWQAGEKYGLTTSTNGVATAATFYLFDVGLYLDPQNTGIAPPWQMPDEAQELAACQRYYYKVVTPAAIGAYRYGSAGATNMDAGVVPFLAQMRVAPAGAATTVPTLENCSAHSISPFIDGAITRVTVTAAGMYRAAGATFAFSARM